MKYQIIQTEDGKYWLSDGHAKIKCDNAFKATGIIREIESCNCSASIEQGILFLEDGTCHDLKGAVQ